MRPPELEKLNYFVGTWTSQGDIKPGPASPGGKLTMTERNQWMDGRFFLTLHSEFESPLGSGSGMGYDAARKVYTYDEFNSTGEAQHSIGTLNGDTWTWTGQQHIGGKTAKTRFTQRILSPTSYAFTFETSPDGDNWATVMDGNAMKK